MLSVDEARTIMLEVAQPLPAETVKLADALGRVLAAPVIAPRDHPPFPSSAMDGYAVRSADTPGSLKVVGEAAAGHGFDGPCEAETAVRIATGGAAPEGADTIVIQEDVTRNGDRIDVPEAKPGKYIRKRGLDFPAGTELLPRARKLDGIALALAAASGAGTLSVVRRPRIAILNSGDELAEPGSTPGPFQIFEFGELRDRRLDQRLGWRAAAARASPRRRGGHRACGGTGARRKRSSGDGGRRLGRRPRLRAARARAARA